MMINDSGCELLGYSRETLLSQRDFDLFPESEVHALHHAEDLAFESGSAHEDEDRITDAGGTTHHVITRKRVIALDGQQCLVVSMTDVSALRTIERQNRYLAYHDSLTGLPNRALLAERMEYALSRHDRSCALLYIDLDRFKNVNNALGNPAGDELIQEFARRLGKIVSASDTVARLGGDEFALLIADTAKDRDATELCRRVLMAVAQPFLVCGALVRVGASIGVVLTGRERIDGAELQRRAEVALNQSKAEGAGSFHIFTEALDERISRRRFLQVDLREALETGIGLEVHFQPVVDLPSGKVTCFEALARWNHPVRGSVPPDEFIPAAEASGLILELGEWALQRACEVAAKWVPPMRLAVNISPVQFVSGDLPEMVASVLARTGFSPDLLDLEITEGVLTQDASAALQILDRIRATGVRIVLDDFGTGYSSLSYFRQFPFDKIKIDRSFIADMVDSKRAMAIVESVISLGNRLDLDVIAEGVETREQFDILVARGCRQAQGFLMGRPLPIARFVGSVLERA